MRSRIDTEATRSFNDPSTAADFDKWLKLDSWDVNEAVALSLGRDPSKVKWKRDIAPYSEISRVAKEFCRRRDRLERAVNADLLNFKMTPTAFVDWAISKKLSLPTALVATVKREPVVSESQVDESKELFIIDALREVLGIDAEISPEEEYEEPEPEAESTDEAEATDEAEVINLKLRQTSDAILSEQEKSNRVLRSFVSVAQHLQVESASYAKWVSIADWYCFEVIDKNSYGGEEGKHLASCPSDEVCGPLLAQEKCGWVIRGRHFAFAHMDELYQNGTDINEESVADYVCNNMPEDFRTTKGKKIDPKYLLRRAFTQDKWWKMAIKQLMEK